MAITFKERTSDNVGIVIDKNTPAISEVTTSARKYGIIKSDIDENIATSRIKMFFIGWSGDKPKIGYFTEVDGEDFRVYKIDNYVKNNVKGLVIYLQFDRLKK